MLHILLLHCFTMQAARRHCVHVAEHGGELWDGLCQPGRVPQARRSCAGGPGPHPAHGRAGGHGC